MDPIRRIIPVKRGFKKFQRRAIVTAFCIGRNIQYIVIIRLAKVILPKVFFILINANNVARTILFIDGF